MNNVIYEIAKRNLKQSKRKYYLFFSIFIVAMLLIGVMTYVDSLVLEKEIKNKEVYGSFYYVIEEIDQETYYELTSNPYVDKTNQMHIYGHFGNNTIGYCDSLSLLPTKLYSGNLPTEENEIAIEKQVLDSMNLSYDLNQEIELTYRLLDDKQVTKTFILCGVLETSADLYTDHLNAITTKTDYQTQNAFYYTTKSGDSFVDTYLLFENSKVIPSMLGQTVESFYAQNTLMNIISMVGMVLIMYSMNLIAQDITKELTLLRMMGSSKGQVALLFFYQISLIGIVAIPSGLLLGILVSFIATQINNLPFVFQIGHLFYVLVILLVSLFIGSALPVISATQATLGKGMRLNREVKKVRRMRRIRSFGLVRRTIHFKKMSVILFTVVASICLCLMMDRFIRIQNIMSSLNNPLSQTQLFISCDDYTKRMDLKIIDELSKHPALGDCSYSSIDGEGYLTYEVDFGFENFYTKNRIGHDRLRKSAIGRIETTDLKKYEAYTNEKQIMIYLPTYYVKIESDTLWGVHAEDPERENGDYDIKIEENRIHVGDKININGDEVEVSYILTYLEILEIEGKKLYVETFEEPYEYTIVVGEEFVKAHDLNYGFSNAVFEVKEGCDLDYLRRDVFNLVHDYYDLPFTVIHNYKEPTNLISALIVQIFYIIVFILVIVLLLTQQLRTQFERRGQDISLYQLIGMNQNQVKKLYLLEGLVLSLTIITLSLLGTLFSQFINLINYGSILDFDIFYSIPKEMVPIYISVYLFITVLIFIVYYSYARRVLKIDKMERLRQII